MNLPNDQFSVKFYLARVLLVIPYLKNNYKYLLLGAAIGGLVGLVIDYEKSNTITYESELIFTIETPGGGNDGGGISSFFGLSSGSESTNMFSSANFDELIKLNFIYKKALLTKVKLFGINDLLINYLFLKSDKPQYVDFRKEKFALNSTMQTLNASQLYLLKASAEDLQGMVIFKKGNEKSSFRSLFVQSNNDTLSYVISSAIIETFSDIYIKNKTKKSTELVSILEKRVDSLRNALYYTQGKLASFADQNQQIIFQSAKITADRLQMNSAQLQGLYSEAVRNLDSYKFSLVKETPLLNIITRSELPIVINKYKFGTYILIGILAGLFLTILVIYFIRVYKEVFND